MTTKEQKLLLKLEDLVGKLARERLKKKGRANCGRHLMYGKIMQIYQKRLVEGKTQRQTAEELVISCSTVGNYEKRAEITLELRDQSQSGR